jgi:hypothetical protein
MDVTARMCSRILLHQRPRALECRQNSTTRVASPAFSGATESATGIMASSGPTASLLVRSYIAALTQRAGVELLVLDRTTRARHLLLTCAIHPG